MRRWTCKSHREGDIGPRKPFLTSAGHTFRELSRKLEDHRRSQVPLDFKEVKGVVEKKVMQPYFFPRCGFGLALSLTSHSYSAAVVDLFLFFYFNYQLK